MKHVQKVFGNFLYASTAPLIFIQCPPIAREATTAYVDCSSAPQREVSLTLGSAALDVADACCYINRS